MNSTEMILCHGFKQTLKANGIDINDQMAVNNFLYKLIIKYLF